MNEKLKKILHCVGAFFVGVFSTFLFLVLHHRGTTDGTGETISGAEETNRKLESAIDDSRDIAGGLAETTDGIKKSVSRLGESVEQSSDIFEEIRTQKLGD